MYHINVWRMTERNKERTHGCALRGKLGKNKVFLPHWFVCMHVLWLYLCGCVFRQLFSLPVRVWSGSRASAKICPAAGQALCFTPDTHRNHPLPWPNATEHTTCMCTLLVNKTCLPLPLSWSPAYFVHVLECVYSHVRTVYLHVRVPSSSNFNTSTAWQWGGYIILMLSDCSASKNAQTHAHAHTRALIFSSNMQKALNNIQAHTHTLTRAQTQKSLCMRSKVWPLKTYRTSAVQLAPIVSETLQCFIPGLENLERILLTLL